MKNVFVRLKEYKDKASSAERQIITFILNNPNISSTCNSNELAKKSFSSSATLIRLCKKLGFTGYKEFQHALIIDIANRLKQNKLADEEIHRDEKLESIISKVTYKNIISLEKTEKLMDEIALKKALELLNNSNTIAFFGIGSSLLVARDAYQKFLRINRPCLIDSDLHVQILNAKNLKEHDLGIIISYSGLTEEMLTCAKLIKDNGGKIIAITRFADSKLASYADCVLYVAATEFLTRTGAMSSRISQLNVVDILYTAYLNQHYDEAVWRIEQTQISKENKE